MGDGILGVDHRLRTGTAESDSNWTWTWGSFSYFGPVEAKKRITVLAALHSEDCDLRGWLKPGRFSRLRRVVAGLQRWTAAGE